MAATENFDGIAYWRTRWATGGGPGKGSRGRLARFKADVLNAFVKANGIQSVIEWGCGNGDQIALFDMPQFTGIDVSHDAIAACRRRFAGRRDLAFAVTEDAKGKTAELALSLDVIYHLTVDADFDRYMRDLFASATKSVVIYSSNWDGGWGKDTHVRHRRFTDWIAKNAANWQLVKKLPNRYPRRPLLFLRQNRSFSEFYIFSQRLSTAGYSPSSR